LGDLHDNFYLFLNDSSQLEVKEDLVLCYMETSSWRKAREMVEKACTHSEQVRERGHERTLELYERRDDIIELSYNTAKTHGCEDFPDGTIVKIDKYAHDGCFHVSVWSKMSSDNHDSDSSESPACVTVPVEQVVMVPESDVVLHSLKGVKHLNGKVGSVVEFNHEIGRYVIIVTGVSKTVYVKPQNILPAYIGCKKEEMVALAKGLSNQDE
jgi:hypothetical protein